MEKLGLGTVVDLRTRMTQAEYIRWVVYFGRKNQRAQLSRGQ